MFNRVRVREIFADVLGQTDRIRQFLCNSALANVTRQTSLNTLGGHSEVRKLCYCAQLPRLMEDGAVQEANRRLISPTDIHGVFC